MWSNENAILHQKNSKSITITNMTVEKDVDNRIEFENLEHKHYKDRCGSKFNKNNIFDSMMERKHLR